MNYKRTILFILLLIFMLTITVNAKSAEKINGTFYADLISYTMPLLKVSSYDEEGLAERNLNIKEKFMYILGLNITDPESIMKREISLVNIDANPKESKENNEDEVQPFKIADKDIELNEDNSPKEDENSNSDNIVANIYDPKLKKQLDPSKPEVLIYHTHTTESYGGGDTDTLDGTMNVCAVGDVLANELENNYGICTIHDKTVHNAYAYDQSYSRSRETLKKYLKQYGDFKLIIDMHRDAAPTKKNLTMKINGESVAKIMFVMAKKNPRYTNNFSVVKGIMNISDSLYPGFCRSIYYYNVGSGYFNQNLSNNAVLIEVGADANSIDEAKASGKYLSRIIGQYINGKK